MRSDDLHYILKWLSILGGGWVVVAAGVFIATLLSW